MSFIVYDLAILVLFAIFVSIFLYRGKKNLKREGLLFLYRTSWGIKFIDYIGKRYRKTLYILSYISIGIGYILMISMIYLFGRIIYIYVAFPNIVKAIKVPPITPLIPYLPRMFKLDFLPEFYFVYWILILAVIAITHEFAHGIFANRYNIKIKSTGFGFFPFFLPVFLAAFVELDEKKMVKKKKFNQLAILSAGTFANVLTAILFLFVMWIFFVNAFTPVGVNFDTYSYSIVGLSGITAINGTNISNTTYQGLLDSIPNNTTNIKVIAENRVYIANKEILEEQTPTDGLIVLYDNTPAINSELKGTIKEINGVKITSRDILGEELLKYSPGETINIKTSYEGKELDFNVKLEKNPDNPEVPWLGIGFYNQQGSGVIGKVYSFFSSFKKPNIEYESKFNEISIFVYNLLWWLILISISVALVNMLPVGIFDGGRFFYLTVLGITGKRKWADKAFSFMTYLFLFLILLLMVFWALSFR